MTNATNFVNLTPHPINVRLDDETTRTFAPSGTVARASEKREAGGDLDGIPVETTVFGEVEGLPAPEAGTVFIVSAIVRAAAEALGRRDVVSPDTGASAVRNEKGHIVAVRGFVRGGA